MYIINTEKNEEDEIQSAYGDLYVSCLEGVTHFSRRHVLFNTSSLCEVVNKAESIIGGYFFIKSKLSLLSAQTNFLCNMND
jgi:hypothetical protein